ncbi:MAG: phospholipase [Magnetococcales bacterium]|nr:phospholipase [Magnetococcales bacterium]
MNEIWRRYSFQICPSMAKMMTTSKNITVADSAMFMVKGGITIKTVEHKELQEHQTVVLKTKFLPNPFRKLARIPTLKGRLLFESAEHVALGDQIELMVPETDSPVSAHSLKISLANGLSLTYGQILALGGDFYGVPYRPISSGVGTSWQTENFFAAFNSLATEPSAKDEATAILKSMKMEIDAVIEEKTSGDSLTAQAYDKMEEKLNAGYIKATGGKGYVVGDMASRYLLLAATNIDHFGDDAVTAYRIGHTAALLVAQQGAKENDSTNKRALLMKAYAMNAFADHFLTDLFSAGHLRVPRKSLLSICGLYFGNFCAKHMHDEDSRFGLNVKNKNGKMWRTYGDKMYFDTCNSLNRAIAKSAVQVSANEVYEVFSNGVFNVQDKLKALDYIPDLVAINDVDNNDLGNFSPMFRWNGVTVTTRSNLNDLSSSQTVFWSTALTHFKFTGKNPFESYAPVPPAGRLAAPAKAPVLKMSDASGERTSHQEVRYAYTLKSDDKFFAESNLSPWSDYLYIPNNRYPCLSDILTGGANVHRRIVYRQFKGKEYEYAGEVRDNTTTTFDDRYYLKR